MRLNVQLLENVNAFAQVCHCFNWCQFTSVQLTRVGPKMSCPLSDMVMCVIGAFHGYGRACQCTCPKQHKKGQEKRTCIGVKPALTYLLDTARLQNLQKKKQSWSFGKKYLISSASTAVVNPKSKHATIKISLPPPTKCQVKESQKGSFAQETSP